MPICRNTVSAAGIESCLNPVVWVTTRSRAAGALGAGVGGTVAGSCVPGVVPLPQAPRIAAKTAANTTRSTGCVMGPFCISGPLWTVYTPCVRPHTGSLAILCLLALTPGGQGTVRASRPEAAAAPAPTGVVTISAVVTDRKGQTLAGLKPGDFELLVDGKPQPIETVQLTSAASPIPRAIAFLLDEFHTPAEDSAAVR